MCVRGWTGLTTLCSVYNISCLPQNVVSVALIRQDTCITFDVDGYTSIYITDNSWSMYLGTSCVGTVVNSGSYSSSAYQCHHVKDSIYVDISYLGSNPDTSSSNDKSLSSGAVAGIVVGSVVGVGVVAGIATGVLKFGAASAAPKATLETTLNPI